MHGILFSELKKFVEARLPTVSWDTVMAGAGVERAYLATAQYPDAELTALVGSIFSLTRTGAQPLLLDFGEFIAPDLLDMYGSLLQPSWRTLDVIENTEAVMHRVVRLRNPGARPPVLHATRLSPGEIELHYGSERRMCSVAKGIAKGIAFHYGERLEIEERSCMLQGAAECVMRLRV